MRRAGPVLIAQAILALPRSWHWKARALLQVAVALALTPVTLVVVLAVGLPALALVGVGFALCALPRALAATVVESWEATMGLTTKALGWMSAGKFTDGERAVIRRVQRERRSKGGA